VSILVRKLVILVILGDAFLNGVFKIGNLALRARESEAKESSLR
jgi:hypothetical protein